MREASSSTALLTADVGVAATTDLIADLQGALAIYDQTAAA
jgi:hypothetical protein